MRTLIGTRAVLRLAMALVLLLLVMPASLAAQETQDTMKLAPKLREARAAFAAGYMTFDNSKVSPLFADDAVVMFQGETYSGRQAVDGWVANSMQGLSTVKFGTSSFTIADAEVVDRNTYMVTTSDGSQVEGTSEATWRRQSDGSWKVIRLLVM